MIASGLGIPAIVKSDLSKHSVAACLTVLDAPTSKMMLSVKKLEGFCCLNPGIPFKHFRALLVLNLTLMVLPG